MPRRLAGARARTALATFAAVSSLAVLVGAGPAGSAPPTVTISGRAYAFNHMDTYLAGATIRVRELPGAAAVTDANGDYALEVPDQTTVTPYIDPPPGYNEIDLQTFHTRGQPIRNANFQTPGDAEYNGLAALLSVPFGPDGRPEQCAIVTTASARNVRGVDYETFHARTPHGVAGATARAVPELPPAVYFNESVIPDRSRTETSEDGGIIWTEVPAGVYRVIAESPTTRFASFLATCEPGRVVNANPPWGAYELSPGEKPLGAGVVAGSVAKVSGGDRAGNRLVIVRLRAAERLRAKLQLRQHGSAVAATKTAKLAVGAAKLRLRVAAEAERGRAKLTVKLTDRADDAVTDRLEIRLPRAPGA
ncbi:MAG: hypothetical protein ABW249_01230 [Solirubrobacterales bacterium]